MFTNEYKPPYLDAVREPGCGPVRIGSQIALQEDMYTLLFVSYFNWTLVEKAQADQHEHETAQEEMFQKHQKEKERAKSIR